MSGDGARARRGDSDLVRPFVVARRASDFPIDNIGPETIVSLTKKSLNVKFDFERDDIIRLCEEPMAVAEVSARLGLLLGVCRLLVAELAAEGFVEISVSPGAEEVDDALLEKAIDAVRRL